MNHNVKLIAVTKPTGEDSNETAEELVAYCARVSNPSNQTNQKTAGKLLKYLIENHHWSPFEMVSLVIEIETTRTIARQILRHRSFSFQEFSQRYAVVTKAMFTQEYLEARLQDVKNRQNSLETTDERTINLWKSIQDVAKQDAISHYLKAIDLGVAKEQARAVLPEGLTMSKMYMSGSLRSWIHYCLLRMGNGTQKEHRDIATDCKNIIVEQFPSIGFLFEPQPIHDILPQPTLEELLSFLSSMTIDQVFRLKADVAHQAWMDTLGLEERVQANKAIEERILLG